MNTAAIIDPMTDAPFDSFCDRNGETNVQLPEAASCQLLVRSDELAQLVIESDGKEIHRTSTCPGQHFVPLTNLLGLDRQPLQPTAIPVQLKSIISMLPIPFQARNASGGIRAFRVTLRSAEDEVRVTFNFRLLTPSQYEAAYARHIGEQSPKQHRGHDFFHEWSMPHGSTSCWSCNGLVAPESVRCGHCGADQEKEQTAKQ